jgi:hypothetical protein
LTVGAVLDDLGPAAARDEVNRFEGVEANATPEVLSSSLRSPSGRATSLTITTSRKEAMYSRPMLRSAPSKKFIALFAAVTAVALSLAPLSSGAAREHAVAHLKLPAERTSPTGNFFTLEAYHAPTSSKAVAEFEMKVCTSAHTPADTAIDPALFTLSLAHGGSVAESTTTAKSPALLLKPLKALQCAEGWLGFTVPKGKAVSKLEYDYNGTIAWSVG